MTGPEESRTSVQLRRIDLALRVLTVVVVIASGFVTGYLMWQMRDLVAYGLFDAVLLTTVAVLAPPLLAYRAGRSVGRTRTVVLGLLLVMGVLYAVLAAQYMTERGSPHPWAVAAFLTYTAAGGPILAHMRARSATTSDRPGPVAGQ